MRPADRVAETVRDCTARFPPSERICIRLDRCRIVLASNSAALVSRLAACLREFLCAPAPADIEILALETPMPEPPPGLAPKAPEPGKTRIKEEYRDLPDGRLVRKRQTGMLFYFGGGQNLALGPCLANDNQVLNFIGNRYIEWLLHQGALLCHASAVARQGCGLLIAGASGAGKSTLALHLLGQGFDFVSNDRVLIRREAEGPRLFGLPKLPRVNPGTLLTTPGLRELLDPREAARYSALPPQRLWELEHKHDVDIASRFGPCRFSLSARLEGLLFLNWRFEAGDARFRPIALAQRPDLLEILIKPVGLFFESEHARSCPDLGPERYLECLEQVDALECLGGVDFPAAVDMVQSGAWGQRCGKGNQEGEPSRP